MAWNTQHYRDLYAGANSMASAFRSGNPGSTDAKFNSTSAIYQAAIYSLYDASVHDFVDSMLREVPDLCIDPEEIKLGNSQSWSACEKILDLAFAKILIPEKPDSMYLEEAYVATLSQNEDQSEAESSDAKDFADEAGIDA
ncbi:hypothetical protein ACN47E_005469 [Coniothyrium glycines]